MRLNWVEKAMMNNPVRSLIQRHIEARRLSAMGGPMAGGRALEVGCGQGVGAGLVVDVFGADRVDAFDFDPHMVRLASQRLARRGQAVHLWTGDAAAIAARDGAYDAVFDFGIIHHVSVWRDALAEVHRVLRPGGRLYAEEVLRGFIENPIWRFLLDHPKGDRFDHDQFKDGLVDCGFRVVATRRLWQQLGWFVAEKER